MIRLLRSPGSPAARPRRDMHHGLPGCRGERRKVAQQPQETLLGEEGGREEGGREARVPPPSPPKSEERRSEPPAPRASRRFIYKQCARLAEDGGCGRTQAPLDPAPGPSRFGAPADAGHEHPGGGPFPLPLPARDRNSLGSPGQEGGATHLVFGKSIDRLPEPGRHGAGAPRRVRGAPGGCAAARAAGSPLCLQVPPVPHPALRTPCRGTGRAPAGEGARARAPAAAGAASSRKAAGPAGRRLPRARRAPSGSPGASPCARRRRRARRAFPPCGPRLPPAPRLSAPLRASSALRGTRLARLLASAVRAPALSAPSSASSHRRREGTLPARRGGRTRPPSQSQAGLGRGPRAAGVAEFSPTPTAARGLQRGAVGVTPPLGGSAGACTGALGRRRRPSLPSRVPSALGRGRAGRLGAIEAFANNNKNALSVSSSRWSFYQEP